MMHGMFVPRNYDTGILTSGLRGVAFDVIHHLAKKFQKSVGQIFRAS